MDVRVPQLAEQLLLIERELRVLGWWSAAAPDPQALASQEPFCVDTLSFAEWLQWIFLPRMKQLLEAGAPLPSVSGIRPMAEMAYAAQLAEVANLLLLLGAFDLLISGHPA